MANGLDLRPLTPELGAEVHGLDLRQIIDDAELFDAVGEAFLRHHVLVFRDQRLDRDDHKAIGRRFGPLHVHPSKRMLGAGGDPEVFTVKADDRTVRNNGGRWHMDVSCEETPPLGSMLRLIDLPPHGGDTLFADMHRAFETLSPPIQRLILDLEAVHDGLQDLRWYGFEPTAGRTYPRATHPMVVTHPDTGRPTLFVNEAFTSHIVGLSSPESDAVLRMLFAHISGNPGLHCRVRWEPDTLVFWDNRCLQHFAVFDYAPHPRRGERVTIAETRPPTAVDAEAMSVVAAE